jgi:hypothetical protein
MSTAPVQPETPQPAAETTPVPPVAAAPDYEHMPETGVRKVLDAMEERDLQRIRWGAVIAGLFLAIGTQILLAMLGVAIGLSAADTPPGSLGDVGLGAGIWMAIASLIALFLGGYAAARLGGAIRRSDGALAGLLTWATSLVLTLWLVGAAAGSAAGMMDGGRMVAPSLRNPIGNLQRGTAEAARSPGAEKGAWATFGGACLSLLAALGGGAAGAVGMPDSERRRRRERHRELRDREIAYRAAREREWDREFKDRYTGARR